MKNKLIIVEGAQGVGKTTITNLLREKIPYSCLIRSSGIKRRDKLGSWKTYRSHKQMLEMISEGYENELNFILDRTFFSEKVYEDLGHKEPCSITFYKELTDKLNALSERFDITLVLLTATANQFNERLKREKPMYSNVEFNIAESLNQQNAYRSLLLDFSVFAESIRFMEIENTSVEDTIQYILSEIGN